MSWALINRVAASLFSESRRRRTLFIGTPTAGKTRVALFSRKETTRPPMREAFITIYEFRNT